MSETKTRIEIFLPDGRSLRFEEAKDNAPLEGHNDPCKAINCLTATSVEIILINETKMVYCGMPYIYERQALKK